MLPAPTKYLCQTGGDVAKAACFAVIATKPDAFSRFHVTRCEWLYPHFLHKNFTNLKYLVDSFSGCLKGYLMGKPII
ncbi:Uncharacterised protein [Kingella negevensis]|uniref:Uncharacterized protein n=1 Tax=Kingella negevensis TaxID=1522312 RepID=A0A238HH54_9NEIS|nr:Uncharacterised protein [Kingella negevensis]